MVNCAVSSCKRRSASTNFKKDHVSYHKFPKDPDLREKWRKFCNDLDNWIPTRTSVVCSEHFTPESYQNFLNRRILVPGAIPSVRLCPCLTQQKQLKPRPGASAGNSSCNISLIPDPDSLGLKVSAPAAPEGSHDQPLDQCRFCAEYSKDCVDVTNHNRPYLTRNKTTLTLNDLTVDLDFNNDALPKTVCGICDRKLQAMYDFFKQVKNVQESLIKLNVKEEIETLIVKTEYESPTTIDEDDVDEIDSKDGIIDSLTITKTVVVTPFSNKRKSVNAVPKTQKKPKIESKDIKTEKPELITDIKEEITETVNAYENYEAENPENDPEIDVKPSVSGLASALVNEMSDSETFS